MYTYVRKVQYYETDMMGFTHHANYIHWMEEARIEFMEHIGFPYSRMESEGIKSPVRSVSCLYKRASTFGDTVSVDVSVESFNGLIMTILYEMRNQKDEILCEGRSEHVFINSAGRLIRLNKEQPEFCRAIESEIRNPEPEDNLKETSENS